MNHGSDDQHLPIIEEQVAAALGTLFGERAAGTVTRARARLVLRRLARRAYATGSTVALGELLTTKQAAAYLGVTAHRMAAIAKNRHDRYGIGLQIPGTRQWLFRPDELPLLAPDPRYRRRDQRPAG